MKQLRIQRYYAVKEKPMMMMMMMIMMTIKKWN